MTVTDDPTVPVTDADPQPDEGEAVAVELVKSGWVRLRWDGRTIRLRRPFFGELKSLRMALEDAADAIAEQSEEVQLIGREILAENSANDEADVDDVERMRVRQELTKRSKIAGRALTAFSDEQRIAWWRTVVDVVGVDGALPEDDRLPSWIADPMLPNTVLQHWRSVPLDRG